MTDQPTNTIASDEEVMAAIAADQEEAIPSFDDDPQASVVAVPVPVQPDSIPTATTPDPSSVGVAVVSSLDNEQPPENVDEPQPTTAKGFLSRIASGTLHVIDVTLSIINHPFKTLSPQRRQLIGYLAIATIMLSLLALYLFPTFMPPRDAISFLTNKSAELSEPPAAQPTPE